MSRTVPDLHMPWCRVVLQAAIDIPGVIAIAAPWKRRPERERATLRSLGRRRAEIEWLNGEREIVPIRLLDLAPCSDSDFITPPARWQAQGGAA